MFEPSLGAVAQLMAGVPVFFHIYSHSRSLLFSPASLSLALSLSLFPSFLLLLLLLFFISLFILAFVFLLPSAAVLLGCIALCGSGVPRLNAAVVDLVGR